MKAHDRAYGPIGATLVLLILVACSKNEHGDRNPPGARPTPSQAAVRAPSGTDPSSSVGPGESEPAPPEGLVAVTGPDLIARVRSSRARGVVVNAWASWCGPCRNEMPMLVALSQSLPQLEFLFVSVDEPSSWSAAVTFLEEQGVALPAQVVRGRLGPFKHALNPEWHGMIPATFLFDRGGALRYFWGGPVFENEIVPVLEDYLAGKKVDGKAIYGLAAGKVVPSTPSQSRSGVQGSNEGVR